WWVENLLLGKFGRQQPAMDYMEEGEIRLEGSTVDVEPGATTTSGPVDSSKTDAMDMDIVVKDVKEQVVAGGDQIAVDKDKSTSQGADQGQTITQKSLDIVIDTTKIVGTDMDRQTPPVVSATVIDDTTRKDGLIKYEDLNKGGATTTTISAAGLVVVESVESEKSTGVSDGVEGSSSSVQTTPVKMDTGVEQEDVIGVR
ncbi:hypothetical protein HDU76_009858, partial [Blyttiomyces sp. JEL0837]